MKLFTHIISIALFCICGLDVHSFAQEKELRPYHHDHGWINGQKEDLLSHDQKYISYDISSLVGHQVPDTGQLHEIQKGFDQHCPVKTMTERDGWETRKHHPWRARPRGADQFKGWDYDQVAILFKCLVEYDLKTTDEEWDRGEWTIHDVQANDNDPNLYFYAIFSDDTDLKIYFYVVFLDTDGAKQPVEGTIQSGILLANKAAYSTGTNTSPDKGSKQGNDTAATLFRQEAKSFDRLLTDKKFVTHAILFDVNSYIIRTESLPFIADLARWLKENPSVKLEIDGYTDDDGTPETNLLLSRHRAEEIKAKLLAAGISKARLTTKGFGSSTPVSSNTTSEGKASNRRVEFIRK